jgi:two-component system KDP operon response regulator KdpE
VLLSPREYALLAMLVQNAGRVLTHRQLLTAVWGPAHTHDVQYLRVYIGHLRQKLDAASLISTEPGVGYRLVGGDAA